MLEWGFQFSLELRMMCVNDYEIKPLKHEKIIKKKKKKKKC